MKTNLLLFLFAFLSVGAFSQVEVTFENEQDYLLYTLGEVNSIKQIGYSVKNVSDENVSWYFKVEKEDNFPDDWRIQICDSEQCYNFNVLTGLFENVLEPGQATDFKNTYIKVLSNGVSGEGSLVLSLYSDKNLENELFTSQSYSFTEETSYDDLVIYPNPTTDYFRLQNDNDVSQVSIQNIVGKEVAKYAHRSGNEYNVSDLRNGMYLVRMSDDKGKVIKTLRLSKR